MAFFSLKHGWNFPSNNNGQIFGIADSGVETFNGTPIKSLAREICQNSLDAHQKNSDPTRIEFETFEIAPSDIPDFPGLKYALERSLEFWSEQTSNKAKAFFKNALTLIKRPKITCMRISDYNTTGLTGSKAEYNTPWCNLTKSSGASDKSGSHGGSFGIGKFAPYACSALRTIFYSTSDQDGICAYQGVSRLTSFRDRKGDITQGTGFYGNDKNTPVFQQISLDPTYSRKQAEHGSDIYILAFSGERDWKDKMIASILDGFLYAVYNEELIVDVGGIEVSKKTLPDLMVSHKTFFQEHADEYYQALIDEKLSRTFEKELTDDPELQGKLTLRMMIMPEFHRRVAMVRQTGMKIKDKGNISGLIPFAGILYIEGDALNGYLRSIENPQHLEWEIDRAENKGKARSLLNSLTRFLKDCLDEMKNDDSEEALDPSVGEYLSANEEDDKANKDRVEDLQDTINDFKIKVTPVRTPPAGSQTNGDGDVEVDDDNGDITVTDVPGEGGGHDDGTGGGGGGGGTGVGTGTGENPVEHKKSLATIAPAKVRVLCRNKDAGEYTITFAPAVSAEGGIMQLFMSAESQNYDAKIVEAHCDSCPDLLFSENRIENLTFVEKQPLTIRVKLDYHDYCSMEVKAYGNKG